MTTSTGRPPLPTSRMLQRSESAKQFAEEKWNHAAALLSARPSLVTPHVFLLVLKSRPPPHVVQFMLELNPRVADIPEEGPSPLLVAVRHNASVQVCSLLLQACPLALIATHSGYDPLMYAKIWRHEESELLSLLSRPLSYWLEQERSRMIFAGQADSIKSLPVSSSPPSGNSNKNKTILTKSASCRNVHSSDEEMHNIKTIAATIVRAQKKQVANLNLHRQQVDQSIQQAQDKNHQEHLAQLQKLEELQQQHFKSQLIALDMKEKRIMSRMKKMERRIHKTMELSKQVREVKDRRQDASLQRVEQDVTSVRATLDAFQARTSKRLEMTELRLKQECWANDSFRNDTRLQLNQLDVCAPALQGWMVASEEGVDETTPVVYATPYLLEDEEDSDEEYDDSAVPLFAVPIEAHRGHGGGSRTNRRMYPKKRSRRNLLCALPF